MALGRGTHLEKQAEGIATMKEMGFEEKLAAQVVKDVLKDIRARPNDDSLLTKLQKMLAP